MAAPLGVLMLDTAFERFPGDVGHPDSWPFPVRFEIVRGATAAAATTLTDDRLLAPFVGAAKKLAGEGVEFLTTSCGFLALYQQALSAASPVPIATSALLEAARLAPSTPPGRSLGILTFNADTLGAAHLAGVGAPADLPIVGLAPDSAMRRDILGGAPADFDTREADVVEAARRLKAQTPNLHAVICECTNFGPHRAAIEAATGAPVFTIVDCVLRAMGEAGTRP